MSDFGDLPFVFSGTVFDRRVLLRPEYRQAQFLDPDNRFIPVCGEDNVLLADGLTPLLLDTRQAQPLLTEALCTVLLGNFQNHMYVALGLPAGIELSKDKIMFTNLRPQFGWLDHGAQALLGYARAMVHWHVQSHFCGKCGAPTESRCAGHELHCNGCGNISYPRVNPAIIVLVTHGDHCLLGRHTSSKRYSTLAGFVEPGEGLEATVRREVQEETNIRVASMQYRSSQPWPYPASLMLGFRALAENTDILCNDGELAEARWFTRAQIANCLRRADLTLSTPQSIAYALLRDWFDEGGSSLDALLPPTDSVRQT
jgi:NAD+ diphosphatase